MQNDGSKKLIAVEFVQRICAGLLFLITLRIAVLILKGVDSASAYYILAIILPTGLLFLVRQLGKSPLIRDLEEICFYDVLISIYGFVLFKLEYPFDSFWILATAIGYIKFIRLIWWGKNERGDLISSWPVFGLLGFFSKNWVNESISFKQKLAIYLSCLIAIAVPALSWIIFARFDEALYLTPILVAILILTKRITAIIETTDSERNEAIKKNAILAARTEMDAHIKERNLDLCHATHDVRSPVNTMIQLAGNLEKCQDVSEAKLAAKHFGSGLRELGDLLDEIIVMAQVTTDVVTQTDELISMDDLSYQLYEKLEPLAHARRVILAADDAPFFVTSNKWLLSRILSNLLTNAIVHGDETTKVRLCIYRNRKHCYIRVWDTGQGMPDANGPDRAANFNNMLKVIHRKRGQNKAQGMTTLSGHGLGLRSVMRMCNTLGITMTLVSKPGKGTMFRFKLPLADPAAIAEKLPLLDAFDQASKG